ncbi:Uncharacterized protein Adt_23474 [Abeliophyllum distichum]|uniref:Uncharacterized protein n=1 Tax=Abeliophyllum distichum TaxID=126358 RepID=A0ABD1SCM9_9LAMI
MSANSGVSEFYKNPVELTEVNSREVSPELVEVLLIRGVDTAIGEELTPVPAGRSVLAEAMCLSCASRSGHWAAMDVISIILELDLEVIRKGYKVPVYIHLFDPGAHECVYVPRNGCTIMYFHSFVAGMRLPLDPFFKRVPRVYELAPMHVFIWF